MKNSLFFNDHGIFKILQFTDIHFKEDNEIDNRTTELMRRLIKKEKPDFIIATGDTVYGPDNTKNLEKAFAPMIEAGVAWSYTFGNHDTEEGEDYNVLYQMIASLPNCLAYNADDNISGMANHYIEVKSKSGKTKWVLFGIDTGNYNKMSWLGGYDYIKKDQIHWFQKVIRDMHQKDPSFSSLVFMHMPLPEYHEVWELETCYGEKREGIGCPRVNSGFFMAMQEVGHTKGVFAGHDHINDFMGNLYGITLAYGRATGYNTYGQDDFLKGARIIKINENNIDSFETYIRLEDDTVIRKQQKHQPRLTRDEG